MMLFEEYCRREQERADTMPERGYTDEEIRLHRMIFSENFSFTSARDEMGAEHFVEVYNSYMAKCLKENYPFSRIHLEIWEDGIHAVGDVRSLRRDRLVAPDEKFWKREKKRLREIGLNKIQIRILMDWATDKLNYCTMQPWKTYGMSRKEYKETWNSAVRKMRRKGRRYVGVWRNIKFAALMDKVSEPCQILLRIH